MNDFTQPPLVARTLAAPGSPLRPLFVHSVNTLFATQSSIHVSIATVFLERIYSNRKAYKIVNMSRKAVKKVEIKKFTIDCSAPVDDNVLDAASFAKFLEDKIKVGGKAGNLKDKVTISCDKSKISVNAEAPFSKRYLKYLSKKYLKREKLRDFLHVIAPNKSTYELRYFNVNSAEAEDEDE